MADSSIQPPPDEISAMARQFWEDEGRPEGKADEHWTRAEAALRSRAQSGHPDSEIPASTPETSASSGEELS